MSAFTNGTVVRKRISRVVEMLFLSRWKFNSCPGLLVLVDQAGPILRRRRRRRRPRFPRMLSWEMKAGRGCTRTRMYSLGMLLHWGNLGSLFAGCFRLTQMLLAIQTLRHTLSSSPLHFMINELIWTRICIYSSMSSCQGYILYTLLLKVLWTDVYRFWDRIRIARVGGNGILVFHGEFHHWPLFIEFHENRNWLKSDSSIDLRCRKKACILMNINIIISVMKVVILFPILPQVFARNMQSG